MSLGLTNRWSARAGDKVPARARSTPLATKQFIYSVREFPNERRCICLWGSPYPGALRHRNNA